MLLLLACMLPFLAFTCEEEPDSAMPRGPRRRGFSGKITYAVIIESKCPLVDSRTLQEKYGSTMTLYIRPGDYKMVYDGTSVKEVLYRGKENKQFIYLDEADSVLWRSCRPQDRKFVRTFKRQDQCFIMDRECDAFSIETPNSTTTYLYDPRLRLSPRYFRYHGVDHFNTYLRRARAPYLKCVFDGPLYKKTLIATNIEEMELEDEIFTRSSALPLMTSEL